MKFLAVVLMSILSFNPFAQANTEPGFSAKMYAILESEEIQTEEIDMATLTETQIDAFQKAAEEESWVWADTILEGEYELAENSKVELQRVEKVFNSKGQQISYRIVFSQAALDFTTEDCTPGHIVAGAFVSLDYKFHFRDVNAIEEFRN